MRSTRAYARAPDGYFQAGERKNTLPAPANARLSSQRLLYPFHAPEPPTPQLPSLMRIRHPSEVTFTSSTTAT